MLESIRRWLARKGIGQPFPEIAAWAARHGWDLKARPEGDALIVESQAPPDAWRLEWGPSQRPYIEGAELRLRAPLADTDAAHLLLMSRPLMQSLDAALFQQYTDDLQTRIDDATPDEMRWLVLYPKLKGDELGPLRERFGALGHPREAVVDWIGGPIAKALEAAVADAAVGGRPLVLVVQRGRLTLRTPMALPEVATVEPLLALFRVAMAETRRVLGAPARPPRGGADQPAADR